MQGIFQKRGVSIAAFAIDDCLGAARPAPNMVALRLIENPRLFGILCSQIAFGNNNTNASHATAKVRIRLNDCPTT